MKQFSMEFIGNRVPMHHAGVLHEQNKNETTERAKQE